MAQSAVVRDYRALQTGRSEAAIRRTSWPDARHGHYMSRIVDLVEDPVTAHSDPEKSLVASHRLHAVGPGVLLKAVQMRIESPSDRKWKPEKFALS